jgi:hypothetical protein
LFFIRSAFSVLRNIIEYFSLGKRKEHLHHAKTGFNDIASSGLGFLTVKEYLQWDSQ